MGLTISHLSVAFAGATRPAVDDVSISLSPGEVVALVGESGSGKSTIARAVVGLLPPTAHVSGEADIDGTQTVGLGEAGLSRVRGRGVSMIFQEPMTSLNPVMSVGAQVRESVRCAAGAGDEHAAAADLLRAAGLADAERVLRRFPHELSGGMCQRVMIAMALAGGAPYLIADEPTTALDVSVQATILDLLRDLVDDRGLGILLITHDLGVVADIADRMVVLRDGVVVETGDVEDVYRDPGTPYTRTLLAASLDPIGGAPVPGAVGSAS